MVLAEWSTEQATTFFLVFTRMGGIMLFAPFLSDRAIPRKVKIAFALILAVLTFGHVGPAAHATGSTAGMIAGVAAELLVGIVIGLAMQLLMSAIQLAGELIGHDIGFAIVNTVDPVTDQQVSVIGQFQYFLALVIFLMLGGDAILIKGLVGSYEVVPLAGGSVTPGVVNVLVEISGSMFELAIKVAAPGVAVLFLVTVALGFLARTVPQMNVLIVGFPLRIGVGLAMLMIIMPVIYIAMEGVAATAFEDTSALLRAMNAGH